MVSEIDLTPGGVERLASHVELSTPQTFTKEKAAHTLRALSARLADVETEVAEWRRQALYHNAEHGKLVVIQCDTEARLAQAVEALRAIQKDHNKTLLLHRGVSWRRVANALVATLTKIGGDT
jgi:nitrate reductase NapAB chaperone NapD